MTNCLRLSILLPVLLLALGSTAIAAPLSEVESNDTTNEARARGPIGYDLAHSAYQGEVSTSNDLDSFVVYAPSGTTQIFVDAENMSPPNGQLSQGNLYIAIYNNNPDDDMLAGQSFEAGAKGRVGINLPEQGSYYVVAGTGCTFINPDCWTEPIQYKFTISSSQQLLTSDPGPPPENNQTTNPPDQSENDNTDTTSQACLDAQDQAKEALRKYKKAKRAYRKKKTKARAKKLRQAKKKLNNARSQVAAQCS